MIECWYFLQPPLYSSVVPWTKENKHTYFSLFELLYSFQQTELLRTASVLLPTSEQYFLPEVISKTSTLRNIRSADRSFCMLSM